MVSKRIAIPWELKYNFIKGMSTTLFKGFMYEIREKHGATEAIEAHEKLCKRENRVENMVNTLKDIFKIEGNDLEAIGKWFEIYQDLTGIEANNDVEITSTYSRSRIIKCPFKTDPFDISDWCKNYISMIIRILNPNATSERLKGMCAGDPYCEFVTRIEE